MVPSVLSINGSTISIKDGNSTVTAKIARVSFPPLDKKDKICMGNKATQYIEDVLASAKWRYEKNSKNELEIYLQCGNEEFSLSDLMIASGLAFPST